MNRYLMSKNYILLFLLLLIVSFGIFNTHCRKNTTNPDDFVSPDSNIIFSEHIHKPIFLPDCASRIGCHIYGDPAAGLDLESPVPTFSSNSNRLNLIVKGNPQASVLYLVLWDDYPGDVYDPKVISRMPKDSPMLSEEKIKAIRIWIQEGAKITTGSQ
jgi:hypothetical protein